MKFVHANRPFLWVSARLGFCSVPHLDDSEPSTLPLKIGFLLKKLKDCF